MVCLVVASIGAAAQDVSSPQPTTPAAQLRLGNSYLEEKNYSMALTWFRKAADQGDAAAQNNVGWLYQNGWGVQQDYSKAMAWYRKAADQGNATAEVNLAWLYRKGYGVQQDYAQAMVWFRKAADQDNAQARANIGWLYEKGLGVKQDYAEAMAWYRKAADQGNADAMNDIGDLYRNGSGVKQDYSEALAWYLAAADKGNADARNNLGWLYEKGLGVKQDYTQAMAWYYRAANQGHAQAQNNLGLLYRNGLGDKQDYGKAMTWFRKAADQGYAKAEVNLGWLYETGLGVPQDHTQAMTWYRKAADQNDADAQNNIGWLYHNGFGVKQDDAEALTWYRKAADQGNARAKANIESLFPNGITATIASLPSNSGKGNEVPAMLPNGIRAPRAINAPDPEYSEEARKMWANGQVILSTVVGPDGLPHDIKVIVSLGSGLDEEAMKAVKTWKFEPATKDGKPVPIQVMIEVNFHLYGSKIGRVEVAGDPQGVVSGSYLSALILEAGKCWNKWTDDKTHVPSIKRGQVAIQFVLNQDGRVGAAEIASSSGDDLLDRGARDCVLPLKTNAPLPPDFIGKDFKVTMQLLYNTEGMVLTPNSAQIALGKREQFYVETAGIVSKTAEWTVTGVGCTEAACGTISSDGLYTAPDVLPSPPFVRIKGALAGASPIAASAIVSLVEKH
jgi:TonB family protein